MPSGSKFEKQTDRGRIKNFQSKEIDVMFKQNIVQLYFKFH